MTELTGLTLVRAELAKLLTRAIELGDEYIADKLRETLEKIDKLEPQDDSARES